MASSSNKDIWNIIASKAIQICKCLHHKMVGTVEHAKTNRRIQTIFSFMLRISSNLYAVGLLSALSSKRDGFLTMKLPVGILLRNCYMDMLYAFYLLSLKDKSTLDEELDILNKDYVKAFCKGGFPVYSDRLQAEGITMDEDLLEHLYGLSIEDTFPNSLDWSGLFDTKQYATPLKNNQIRSSKNNEKINIERIYEKISSSDNPYKEIIKKVYSYYKFFSQYEHYSEGSFGDILANFGSDNVSYPMALQCIEDAVNRILVMDTHGN